MKIIDKTNENWEIGDTVIDNDGRIGMIKKDKDDDFVIIRIDDNHVGCYYHGLAYGVGKKLTNLKKNFSTFRKVNDNDDNEEWQPGDFVKDNKGNIGLIVNDHGIFEIVQTRAKKFTEKAFNVSFFMAV